MRVESVLVAYETVRALADVPVTHVNTALKLANALRILTPIAQNYEESRQELLREYACVDSTGELLEGEDGDATFSYPEDRLAFETEWKTAMDEDLVIPALFDAGDFEGLNVTGMMLYNLLDLLE